MFIKIISVAGRFALRWWRLAAIGGIVLIAYNYFQSYNDMKIEIIELKSANDKMVLLNKSMSDKFNELKLAHDVCIGDKELIARESQKAIDEAKLERVEFNRYYEKKLSELEKGVTYDDAWIVGNDVAVLQDLRKRAISRYKD